MATIHDIELTDAQIAALCSDTHIVTSNPYSTETTVQSAWVLLNGRRYTATVYSQTIALNWLSDGRATEMRIIQCFRHPQTEPDPWS